VGIGAIANRRLRPTPNLSHGVTGPRRPSAPTAGIYVLAGTNGAGKSSIGGEALRQVGVEFFNPDAIAQRIRTLQPTATMEHVNSLAWHTGRRLLEQAIVDRRNFAFETTLGGASMTGLLARAADAGLEVRVWYVGLATPDLHLARVRARVARGGHDIPEDAIRRRFDQSRLNLIRLLGKLTELRLYDNSAEADPAAGVAPKPVLLLHWRSGRIIAPADLHQTPDWAQPIIVAAAKLAPQAP
jgi:predicted ABC-type ATPase